MSFLEDIKNRRDAVRNNIAKGFGAEFTKSDEDGFEKAVYADTYENRKLNRVGQEYHRSKGGGNAQQGNTGKHSLPNPDFEWKFPKTMNGADFSDFVSPETEENYPKAYGKANKELNAYLKKHDLEDELAQSGRAQMEAFDNLPEEHKKAITDIINKELSQKQKGNDNSKAVPKDLKDRKNLDYIDYSQYGKTAYPFSDLMLNKKAFNLFPVGKQFKDSKGNTWIVDKHDKTTKTGEGTGFIRLRNEKKRVIRITPHSIMTGIAPRGFTTGVKELDEFAQKHLQSGIKPRY